MAFWTAFCAAQVPDMVRARAKNFRVADDLWLVRGSSDRELFVAPVRSWLLTQQSTMPLTPSQLEELQQEYFAEDVPILPEMASWTEDAARAYFDSGGATKPGAAVTLSGLFALPPSKLINGSNLDMSTLAGKPAFIMNVASR